MAREFISGKLELLGGEGVQVLEAEPKKCISECTR